MKSTKTINKTNYISRWTGDFVNGKMHGEGQFTDLDGNIFAGKFNNGQMPTHIAIHYANGDTYCGGYRNGKYDGKGKLRSNNTVFTGVFSNGNFVSGLYVMANGDTYKGYFKNNKFHGHGVYSFKDGRYFSGQFFLGNPKGTGKLELINGTTLKGCFSNDFVVNGCGTYIFNNGDYYYGNIANNLMHGQGTYTFKNGQVYIGQFDNNLFDGKGVLYNRKHQEIYNGQFKKGLRSGMGKEYLANGDVYEGNFLNNQKHGNGKITDKKGVTTVGVWSNDNRYATNNIKPISEIELVK